MGGTGFTSSEPVGLTFCVNDGLNCMVYCFAPCVLFFQLQKKKQPTAATAVCVNDIPAQRKNAKAMVRRSLVSRPRRVRILDTDSDSEVDSDSDSESDEIVFLDPKKGTKNAARAAFRASSYKTPDNSDDDFEEDPPAIKSEPKRKQQSCDSSSTQSENGIRVFKVDAAALTSQTEDPLELKFILPQLKRFIAVTKSKAGAAYLNPKAASKRQPTPGATPDVEGIMQSAFKMYQEAMCVSTLL